MSRIDTVGIFGVYDGDWKAAKVNVDGKLETTASISAGTGLATEDKQDDQILELQSMVTSLNSIDGEVIANGVTLSNIDSEVGSQSATLISISDNTTATSISVGSIDDKLTIGSDDEITSGLQVVAYGRKDATPSGLRAIKTDFEGRVFEKNEDISSGSDSTLTNAQQVLCYGRDGTGTLDALKTDTDGRLEVTAFQPEPDLIPYTSFINNITLPANTQSTQTIDMNGYRNLQIVGQTGSANDKLGFAFYDGVAAWRSDGVQAGIFYDGTINHFSLILRDIGASSVKIENLQNQAISNLYVSVYRY